MNMKPVPEYADNMSSVEFILSVRAGAFIPDDGCGYWSTETEMDYDSDVWNDTQPQWATHVAWFNR